jgi:hypothetical protein
MLLCMQVVVRYSAANEIHPGTSIGTARIVFNAPATTCAQWVLKSSGLATTACKGVQGIDPTY